MKLVSVGSGEAIVDDADFDRVIRYKWFPLYRGRTIHAIANSVRTETIKSGNIYMHRLILNAPHGVQVDHVDHNGLNNIRANLRFASVRQNQINQLKQSTPSTSRFKGVCWASDVKKWRADINIGGRGKFLGFFKTEREAAYAYDAAAVKYHGEFACPNFRKCDAII